MRSTLPGRNKKTKKMQGKMNVELLVSLVSEHNCTTQLYDKFVWFWQVRKYLISSSEWWASVRSVKLRSTTLCTRLFLFYIKRHLMSGNEFACSLGSSSTKIAWVWTQKTRWKTLTNNARRYSSRCVRAFSQNNTLVSISLLKSVSNCYIAGDKMHCSLKAVSWAALEMDYAIISVTMQNACTYLKWYIISSSSFLRFEMDFVHSNRDQTRVHIGP